MYHYLAHGLHIASELACPELWPYDSNGKPAQVRIRYGQVPHELPSPTDEGTYYQANGRQFLLKLKAIGRFLVSDGQEILIEPAQEELQGIQDEIRLFLLGTALGVLLHQRGQLILHGSAIEISSPPKLGGTEGGRGAVVFVGRSGAGKSTLAAAFGQRGYRVLADDVSAIALDSDDRPVIYPGICHIKLWDDAAEKLGYDLRTIRRLRPQVEKYSLSLREQFDPTPVPLLAVYQLTTSDKPELDLKPVSSLAKFRLLLDQTYRDGFVKIFGSAKTHFQQVTRVAQQINIRRVTRPTAHVLTKPGMQKLIELLEQDFNTPKQ